MIWLLVIFGPVAIVGAGLMYLDQRFELTDGILPFIGACLIVLALVGMTGGFLGATADRITCRNTANNVGLPHKWSMSAGCYLQVEGRWLPREEALRSVRILGLENR